MAVGYRLCHNGKHHDHGLKCREHHCIVGSCPRIRIEPNAWPVHINGRMWYFCRKTKEKSCSIPGHLRC
jgi:hypothetical protein